MTDQQPLIRLTVTAEFPRAEDVQAHRFNLNSKLTGDREGVAVVCFEARYASVRWTGADRPTRLHAPPSVWMDLKPELQALVVDAVAPVGLGSFVAGDRALSVVCTAVRVFQVAPFAVLGELDALLNTEVV